MHRLLKLLLLLAIPSTTLAQFGIDHTISRNLEEEIYHFKLSDLDGDGHPDLVAVSSDGFTWNRNVDGQGTFGLPNVLGLQSHPYFEVVDIDSDGDRDIVFKSSNGNQDLIRCYKNLDGAGNFGDYELLYEATDPLTYFKVADMDGDADLDFILFDETAGNLSLLLNDGAGNFGNAQVIDQINPLATLSINEVLALGDINNDNLNDILTVERINIPGSNEEYAIIWYQNTGSGNFMAKQTIRQNLEKPWTLFIEDIQQDGKSDIIVSLQNRNQIGITQFPNTLYWLSHLDGNGSFDTPEYMGEDRFNYIEFVDLDNDLDLDIVARQIYKQDPSVQGNKLVWFEQKNSGSTFSNGHILVDETISGQYGMDVYDFDNDGDLDILTGFPAEEAVGWIENKKDENAEAIFNQADNEVIASFGNATHLELADIDNDGDLDVYGARLGLTKSLHWFRNENGQGLFSEQQSMTVSETFVYVRSADIDNDGDLDLLTHLPFNWQDSVRIALFENTDGQGTYSDQITIELNNHTQISYFELKDIDGDDKIDILITSKNDNQIFWYKNLGSNNFANAITIQGTANPITAATTADIDGDGDADLLAFSRWSGIDNSLTWYENVDGQGSFGPAQFLFAWPDHSTMRLRVGDMDGDGDLDLVVRHVKGIDYFIQVLKNTDGQGNFVIDYDSGPVDIAGEINLDDLDGDNDLDLVVFSSYESAWYENEDGQGNFVERFLSDELTDEITDIGDIDGDGDMDVIHARFGIHWLENSQSQAYFNDFHTSNFRLIPYELDAFDLDGDLDVEVVVNTNHGNSVSQKDLAYFVNGEGPDTTFFDKACYIGNASGVFYQVDDGNDGDNDVIALNRNRDTIFLHQNNNGLFEPIFLYSPNEKMSAIYPYDVDNDGDIDLVFSTEVNPKLYMLENTGGNIFNANLITDISTKSDQLIIKDMDGNGNPDLVFIAQDNTALALLNNITVNGSADAEVTLNDNSFFDEILIADFDNDNDQDIAIRMQQNNRLSWYENMGSDQYEERPLSYPSNTFPDDFSIGDVDLDNDIDIIFCSEAEDQISWFENTGLQNLFNPAAVITDTLLNPVHLVLKDMDLDTDLDILYTTIESGSAASYNQIGWIENLTIDDQFTTISGICYYDENANGQYDATELGLANTSLLLTPENNHLLTNFEGEYRTFIADGDYIVTPVPNTNWVLSSDSTQYHISINGQSSSNNHFGFVPAIDTSDFDVDLTTAATRCGFQVPFWMSWHNNGTIIENGSIRLDLDTLVDYITIFPTPDSISTDQNSLYWNVDDFYPAQNELVNMVLQMPGTESIGDTIHFNIYTSLVDSSGLFVIDTSAYAYEIRCAYDPNDKLVEPDRFADENYALLDEELSYTIRFQNTGNDTAFTVVVTDQLDLSLDWSTFRVVTASHAYVANVAEDGLATFRFENILLPDSTTNLQASQGFVKFKITPLAGLDENTVINNEANIFFDFNPPILTNEVTNTLVSNIPIIFDAMITSITCHGDQSGRITTSILAEIPPYTYAWSDPSLNGPSVEGLDQGSYSLTITDGLGNTLIETFEITAPDPIESNAVSLAQTSAGNNGSISLAPSGGTPPYTFNWADFPSQDTSALNNLSAATYLVTITDANNCTHTESIVIDFETSAQEIDLVRQLSLAPNPSSGLLWIDLQLSQQAQVSAQVMNPLGQTIFHAQAQNLRHYRQELDLSLFPPGVYFLKLKINKQASLHRIVLVR